ncbi:MAG TPA: glycosyltransferase family 4 protein [Solirubrobacterales bacterium]|nr:glycosyltransferase family 4 protein [Solirubrobacterales bacterium]
MRILQVSESFATGTMEVVRMVAEGAAHEGHRVAIAYGKRPETPSGLRQRVGADVDLIALPWTGRSVGAQLRTVRELRRLCDGWSPDVIHLHSSFAGFVGALGIASFGPTIYTPHSYSFLGAESGPRRATYRLAERLIARRVTMVGAVSQHEARLAQSVGARRVHVVPNGIPELDRAGSTHPPREASARPSIVAAGRIVPQRRPVSTARILRRLSHLADVCWIGGPGPDLRLEESVRDLGIPVTGWVGREEAVRRLSGATVLLNWSAWDSHPLSVLEAMAFDVLVIGSDIEANRELLGANQIAATEEEAVRLVCGILDDETERRMMLEDQRRRAARFGSTRMVRDWLRVYRALSDRATCRLIDGGRVGLAHPLRA